MEMNSIRSVLGCLAMLTLVSACSETTRQVEVRTVPVERPRLNLPLPDEVNLRDVQWLVITPENYESVIAQLTADGQSVALFAVTGDDYEDLSKNLNDIRTLLSQYKSLVIAYQSHYE